MEAILTTFFGSSSDDAARELTAADVTAEPGDLCVVRVTPTYSITARVLEVDPLRGIRIRETYPLGKVPADWEPAHFYARPETVVLSA